MRVFQHLILLTLATSAAAEALPDGEISTRGTINAYLTDPTTRYAHGALGDVIEAGGFAIERDGKIISFKLDENHVFEDRRVRLADIDSDQKPEAIIIRANLNKGAAIAIYDISGSTIKLKAESKNIGIANRWLNIAGIANFTGSGELMIAAVITPHLTGTLTLFKLSGKTLTPITSIDGYTNHINGSRNLDLAKLSDKNNDGAIDITLPVFGEKTLATISFKDGKAQVLK